MKNSSCFFIGHKDAPSFIYPALLFQTEKLIAEHGVHEFYIGHYGSFGTILDQIEKGLPEYLNFIQDHPTSVDPDLFKTLLDFPLYLSQLRRREGI